MNQGKLSTQIVLVPPCQAPSASTTLVGSSSLAHTAMSNRFSAHASSVTGNHGWVMDVSCFFYSPRNGTREREKEYAFNPMGQVLGSFFSYDLSLSPSQSPDCDSGRRPFTHPNPSCYQGLCEAKIFLGIHCCYLAGS